jgi:putative transposase
MIDKMRLFFSVSLLCRVFVVSASGYHAWRCRPPSMRLREDARLEVEIRAAHRRTRETYGPERLQRDLADHGVAVGVHRIRRLRKKLGLRCKQKRRFKATTDSRHVLPVAENLLGQRFQASAPSQVWVTDITYIPTDEGWLYLAGHKDLYTRKIVGYAMGPRMTKNLVTPISVPCSGGEKPCTRPGPPLGSRKPVLCPRVPQTDRSVRNAGIHERQGKLL